MIEHYVSPDELRRLGSALLVILTTISLYALFAFLIVPSMRNANAPVTSAVEAPQGETGWLDPAEYPAAKSVAVPPVDPKTVMSPTPEMLARGRAVFAETCAPCHGTAGAGNGSSAATLKPLPRDFTRKEGWKNGYRIPDIYRTLEQGIPGSGMVSYNFLKKRDRMALVHFVQSLGAFDHGPEDPNALGVLASAFASGGEVIPARIPVSAAMKCLEREAATPQELHNLESASGLLRKSIVDKEAAETVLAGLGDWPQDVNGLASRISAGLPGNGFSPSVATYTLDSWRTLQEELSRSVAK